MTPSQGLTQSGKRKAGVALILVGPLLLLFGVLSYFSTRSFLEGAEKADGVIVRLEEEADDDDDDDDDSVMYRPVYTFTDAAGNEHTVRSDTSSDSPQYDVGDRVKVLYDPADPTDAVLDSFFDVWGLTLALCALGFVLTAAGVGVLLFPKRFGGGAGASADETGADEPNAS